MEETRSDVQRLTALLGVDVPPYKHFAMLYLENHGFRFCVDFGTDNAVEKAREHWTSRKR